MDKIKLDNGLNVLIKKRSTDSVTIQLCVKVGSNNEKKETD